MAKRARDVQAQRRYSLKSMKLQILSDLHLEMVKPPYSWRIPETEAEVVVLAGDIGVGLSGVKWAIREAELSRSVPSMCLGTTSTTENG
jgi:hypothetical protein